MKKCKSLAVLVVWCMTLFTANVFAAGPPIPFRIGGTLTIDGVQKLQADTGIIVKVTKPDGTGYTDASGNPAQATSLNVSNWYIINVPIYDATAQSGGANSNDSAVIHVLLNGTEISVTSPASGALTIGGSGTTQQIDIVAATPIMTATHTGDINADGNVTISDALMALRIAVGLIPMDAKYLADGDVAPYINGKPQPDENINISDALMILRKCVGLINW